MHQMQQQGGMTYMQGERLFLELQWLSQLAQHTNLLLTRLLPTSSRPPLPTRPAVSEGLQEPLEGLFSGQLAEVPQPEDSSLGDIGLMAARARLGLRPDAERMDRLLSTVQRKRAERTGIQEPQSQAQRADDGEAAGEVEEVTAEDDQVSSEHKQGPCLSAQVTALSTDAQIV
jgi:hypothetical protein